jgi:type IV fimbrial biogenesis protein FimT
MKHGRLCPQRGLSLIESVVALGIAAGALGAALPAMQDFVQAASLSAASDELLADFQLARSEALKRNRRVALCKSADSLRCTAAGGWEQGWIVFHDENNNGRADAGEEVIRRRESLRGDLRARGNQPVADYVSYTALGVTKSRNGAFQAGTLTVCRVSALPGEGRQLIVNAVGRPRIQRATVASCDA